MRCFRREIQRKTRALLPSGCPLEASKWEPTKPQRRRAALPPTFVARAPPRQLSRADSVRPRGPRQTANRPGTGPNPHGSSLRMASSRPPVPLALGYAMGLIPPKTQPLRGLKVSSPPAHSTHSRGATFVTSRFPNFVDFIFV